MLQENGFIILLLFYGFISYGVVGEDGTVVYIRLFLRRYFGKDCHIHSR